MAVRSALNVLVGATITPLQQQLKKGVGLVKDFSKDAAKAASLGSGFKASAAKAASITATMATSASVAIGTAVGESLDRSMQAATSFAGGFVKTLGAAGLAAGAAMAAGLKVSLNKFAEVETASLRLSTVLKGAGAQSAAMTQQLQGYARQLSATTGISQAEILSGLASVAQAGVVDQGVMKQTVDAAANLAVALGTDLSGALSQLTAAQQDPRTGYLQLAAAGMAFSDAQVNSIQSMQASGDLLGAQAALADAVKTNYESAAEAAGGTLAGGMNTLWASISNVAATVGESLTPSIQMAVGMMTDWVKGLDEAGIKAVVFEVSAKAIGWVVDGMQMLKVAAQTAWLGVKTLGLGATELFKWMTKGAAEFIRLLEMIPGTTQGTAAAIDGFVADIEAVQNRLFDSMVEDANSITAELKKPFASQSESVKGLISDMTKGAQAAAAQGKKMADSIAKPAEAMKQISAEARKAQEAATSMIVDMKQQLDSFGMEDYAAQAKQLGAKGANDDQVAQIKKLGSQLKGKELAQSLETPFEKFQREMKKLDQLKADGGIDDVTHERAKGKLVGELQSALPQNKIQAGGALMQGSQEARSAILSFKTASRNNDPQQAIKALMEQEAKQLELQTQYLKKLAETPPRTSAAFG